MGTGKKREEPSVRHEIIRPPGQYKVWSFSTIITHYLLTPLFILLLL